MPRPTRKVWLYKATLVEMSEVKKGDLFQMQKAAPDDNVSEDELYLAIEDAKPLGWQEEPSTHSIMTNRMIPDPTWGQE